MGRAFERKPIDGEGMRRRLEATLFKAKRGRDLTKKELMIVQWVTMPGGCRTCSTAVRASRGEN